MVVVRAISLLVPLCLTGCLLPSVGDLSGASSDASTTKDATADVGPTDAGTDASIRAGLVGEWRFDEGNGSIAKDTSGHGHDGAIASGTWVSGHSGAALQLDGSASSLVTVPASPDFDRPAGAVFTITAWVRFPGNFSHQVFVSVNFGPSNATYGLEAHTPTLINYFDDSNHIADSPVTWGTGWHHAAVVVDGSKPARVFFDGVMVGAEVGDTAARTCTSLTFGGGSYGDRMQGALDTVRFYRRALSDQEVAADMNQ